MKAETMMLQSWARTTEPSMHLHYFWTQPTLRNQRGSDSVEDVTSLRDIGDEARTAISL